MCVSINIYIIYIYKGTRSLGMTFDTDAGDVLQRQIPDNPRPP